MPEAEFAGVGRNAQESSFMLRIERARNVLGVDLHAFGAPGNAFDTSTADALVTFPQLVVWLFGDSAARALERTGVMVLPRLVEFEAPSVGTVADLETFFGELDALASPNVVTLQAHPFDYDDKDLARVRQFFERTRQAGKYRFTSPFAWCCWEQDRDAIILTQTTDTSFVLDLSQATFDHSIQFDPDSETSASVEEL